jgi:hypothetical protein
MHQEPCRKNVGERICVLDENGTELGECGVKSASLSVLEVVSLMIEGLETFQNPVPRYLRLLHEEEVGRTRIFREGSLERADRQAFFGTNDFCAGEVEFGGLSGVLATRIGHVNHQEVIQVTYDPSRLCFCSLIRFAIEHKLVNTVYYQTNDERIASQIELQKVNSEVLIAKFSGTMRPEVIHSKYALRKTILSFVPLTDLQATRANFLVDKGAFDEAVHLLSPWQGRIMMSAMRCSKKNNGLSLDVPIIRAWERICDLSGYVP